jgi:predicted GNAT family N-acyltransferase
MTSDEFSVRIADWTRDGVVIDSIRNRVFVVELGVPVDIERDGRDPACRHAIAETSAAQAIGCGRLLPDGRIGRIAVVREWRRHGVGGEILDRLIGLARADGHSRVVLNAEANAIDFYARYGFAATGEPWLEAGLEHVTMERRLD